MSTTSLLQRGVYAATCVFAVLASAALASFTAEDAYIVGRYAVNARDTGEWVFNRGEHVSALTSPLHGLLSIVLSSVASDPIPVYKAVAAVAVLASCALMLASFGIERREAMPLAAAAVAPKMILWTFGGLETPLLAAIATTMAALYSREKARGQGWLIGVAALGGLAVVTRYDAVLFAGPVVIAAIFQARCDSRARLLAVAAAALLPVVWLVYSWLSFGSVLPTSFYIKTPSAAFDVVLTNVRYMVEHLVISGVGVMAMFTLIALALSGAPGASVMRELRARGGLHAGLAAVLLYGSTMATVHMMFAFRHFAPYLASTALALAYLARPPRAQDAPHAASRLRYAAAAVAALILIVHVAQADALYRRSLQGLGTFGEYAQQGAAGYMRQFIPAMEKNAADIQAHWSRLGNGRPPRIWTFAAGTLPYSYRDSYIYEELISFRKRCPLEQNGSRQDARMWRAHADYIHAFTRHGGLRRLLAPVPVRRLTLISEQPIFFNGRHERLLVYYNPSPLPNVLPPGINDPCIGAGRETS
jgi:arabinofuranosyltransferase